MMTIASETLLGIRINDIVYTMQVCKLLTLSQSTHLWNLYAMFSRFLVLPVFSLKNCARIP